MVGMVAWLVGWSATVVVGRFAPGRWSVADISTNQPSSVLMAISVSRLILCRTALTVMPSCSAACSIVTHVGMVGGWSRRWSWSVGPELVGWSFMPGIISHTVN